MKWNSVSDAEKKSIAEPNYKLSVISLMEHEKFSFAEFRRRLKQAWSFALRPIYFVYQSLTIESFWMKLKATAQLMTC